MTPNTWNRVAEIAGQALEQPPAKRQEFVHAQCGGDRALYDAVMDMLRAADEMGGEFLAGTPQLEPIEEEFGRYRAIREIGHGGMSLVYLGERRVNSSSGWRSR